MRGVYDVIIKNLQRFYRKEVLLEKSDDSHKMGYTTSKETLVCWEYAKLSYLASKTLYKSHYFIFEISSWWGSPSQIGGQITPHQ